MEEKNVILKIEDGIAIVKFNRPKALNALNTEMLIEIDRALEHIRSDADVKVVVMTGEGKAFIAGAAIDEMRSKTPDEARAFSALGNAVFEKIETFDQPVIAAVNGFALGGGCELSMACDIRIASEKAKFGQPEVGLGITPGFGGTQRLSRIVGLSKAKELIFTGAMIDAAEAQSIGLVDRISTPETLMADVMALAGKIASNSATAVRYAKAAIGQGFDASLEAGLQLERNLFSLCFASPDQSEGMAAFIEKRKPEFK